MMIEEEDNTTKY
jgi:hypothetical protein